MENEQPTNPQQQQPELTIKPAQAPAASSAPAPLPAQSLSTAFSAPATPTPTATQPSGTPAPVTSAEPEPKPHGKLKWIIAVVVFLIAGTLAWFYFSGFFNPAGQTADQLYGAATQDQTQETQEIAATQDQTQTTEETQVVTQVPLNACPQGQTNDPTTNQCACDINNNYFPFTLAGAYTQPSAGLQPLVCTTCAALSDEILKLGLSSDPADVTRKDALQNLSITNNCSPCAIYDDKISAAYQSKSWDKYFNFIVQKSTDPTCGRSIPTCDALKWQLLFLQGLRDRASKDPETTPDMLLALKQKQQSLEEDLGNNTACYNMQNLCSDLKTAFETTTQQTVKNATPITTTPLFGQNAVTAQTQMQETTAQQTSAETMLSATSTPDLGTVTPAQLFDKDFYLLHCPVDNLQTLQVAPTTQLQTAPVKVSRTKKTTTTQQTP